MGFLLSTPCDFYLDSVFQVVSHEAFIRGEVFASPPVVVIQAVV